MALPPTDRLLSAGVLVVAGVAIAASVVGGGVDFISVATLGLFVALAWWSWPWRKGRHVSHDAAQDAAGDDDVIVYWRPG